jgi:plasmid stabilization system protein ParE
MTEIVKRPRVRQDLKATWRYSFEQWCKKQADKYLAELAAGIARLRDNPCTLQLANKPRLRLWPPV